MNAFIPKKQVDESRKLSEDHVRFLTSEDTLEKWSGLTVLERTIKFGLKFPNKRIAVTSLRNLYLKNGIKFKSVRKFKAIPEYNLDKYK